MGRQIRGGLVGRVCRTSARGGRRLDDSWHAGYEAAMPLFDLDMGFAVDEIDEGLARLLRRRGLAFERTAPAPGKVIFDVSLDGGTARIEVGPMPEERRSPFAFPPRSLLEASGDAPATTIERLRKDILFAFLRVAG